MNTSQGQINRKQGSSEREYFMKNGIQCEVELVVAELVGRRLGDLGIDEWGRGPPD